MATERLKTERADIMTQIAAFVQLSKESGEDIDAPLGSEGYIDHGYMAQARELEERLAQIDAELTAIDDHSAAQRNLPL